MPQNPVISSEVKLKWDALHTPKHSGAVCIANYKGGVGKTTLVYLLGNFLAEQSGKKILLFDIDPQCSLSLAAGFDPDAVSKTELTVYNLVKPDKWTEIRKTNFDSYAVKVPDTSAPKGLHIIKGSFEVENLDIRIAESGVGRDNERFHQLCLYCKNILNAFHSYDFILVDCPPNKMYLTQAMLRACAFYLPVTIPDRISIYGMPRLLRWVREIRRDDRPKLLGYVLNAINRTGGPPGGKVYSQQDAEARLEKSILRELEDDERTVIGNCPSVGNIPRLDAVARFLGDEYKYRSRDDLCHRTSNQPTVEECLVAITREVVKRMDAYRAQA